MKNMLDDFVRIIRERGDSVGFNTAQCKNWEKEHKNCNNCPTELGCGKVVSLGLLTLSGQSPLEDHLERILKTKTPQELLDIDLRPGKYFDLFQDRD